MEKSYSTFKVRRADLVHGKEQWLHFAGAAVKRYPMSKVRETQVGYYGTMLIHLTKVTIKDFERKYKKL